MLADSPEPQHKISLDFEFHIIEVFLKQILKRLKDMTDEIDYETTDDGHEMREEDEGKWATFLGVRKSEDTSAERVSKKSRMEVAQANLDVEQDTVASQLLGAITDPAARSPEDSEPKVLVLNEEEEATPEHCILKDLLSSPPTCTTYLPSLSLADLCYNCRLCKIMRKVRVHPSSLESDGPAEGRRADSLQFWARVDRFADSIYWTASQVDGDTTYPIIQTLNKEAVLDHPFMRKCNSKFKLAGYDNPMDIPHIKEPGKRLSPIQAEELRLNKGLICAASHYSELSYNSRAQSKLEALGVIDNIVRSLRILWLAELRCRKSALDESL